MRSSQQRAAIARRVISLRRALACCLVACIVTEVQAQTTAAPTTAVPTISPSTAAPTSAPSTTKPTTNAPTTAEPTTNAPTTAEPTTNAPTTAAPSTDKPTTARPTSAPTLFPTHAPTFSPTVFPTETRSSPPTLSIFPTVAPTSRPSPQPVSSSPSSMPSDFPTASIFPTVVPSSRPSPQPVTPSPSSMPSDFPTASIFPTVVPSSRPSPQPVTPSPSSMLSDFPTASIFPTVVPSSRPSPQPVTPSPSSMPSEFPTISQTPSSAPTSTHSQSPSPEPSGIPSLAPSSRPSLVPSSRPSLVPSSRPSQKPIVGTRSPTKSPSAMPSLSTMPSAAPVTSAPTKRPTQSFVFVSKTLLGIQIKLTGMKAEMNEAAIEDFEKSLVNVNNDFYNSGGRRRLSAKDDITEFETSIKFERQQLGGNNLIVYYQQTVKYRKPATSTVSAEDVVLEPFTSETTVERLITDLRNINAAFSTLESISSPTIPNQDGDDDDDDTGDGGDSSGFGLGIIIAIAGGAFAVAVVLFAAYKLRRSRNKIEKHEPLPATIEPQRRASDGENGERVHDDGVSAVSDPATMDGSKAGFGRGDQSIETVDYDYSKAYGGGENSVVSSAGGTMGADTRETGSANISSRLQGRAALGASFDSETTGNSGRPEPIIQEQIIEISAPPGKLGVVIDTPDTGAPVVHAVKDSSVIGGLISVGDQLIMVDDIDVSNMTAIKVSKLISKKSANPQRKLTIVRKVVIDSRELP